MNTNIDLLEDLMLRLAEGDKPAADELKKILSGEPAEALQQWPPESRERWLEAVDMVLAAMAEPAIAEDFELLEQFARLDCDSQALRDRLGEWARKHFSSYPDPGGLISALGIHQPDVSCRQLPLRCRVFAALQEGNLCCHPSHGIGSVLEIDGLANEIRVHFNRTINFTLSGFLNIFHLIHQDSLLAELIRGWQHWSDLESQDRNTVRNRLEHSLLPPTRSIDIFRRCLVDGIISERQFNDFFMPAAGTVEPASETEQEPRRSLHETRSLQELKTVLETITTPAFSIADRENIELLLQASAPRPDQTRDFALTLLLLWTLASEQPWLLDWIKQNGKEAVCWNDREVFFNITDSLAAKNLPSWFGLTVQAVGYQPLAGLALGLPLKSLPPANRVLSRAAGDKHYFTNAAGAAVAAGNVSADLVVWIWQHGEGDAKQAIRDPVKVFQALSRPVQGSLIKGNRQLRNLLIGNEEFQRFLMEDGTETAVKRVISCIRNISEGLDAGEKQSLLVRFARLFPQARQLIERRTVNKRGGKTEGADAAQAVTSIRSYEARREELHAIITKKIPANSRAIAHARSYGDLRENAEYKAAKDEQSYLLSRREELERSLKQVKPTDFSTVQSPGTVVPGTTVQLRWIEEQQVQDYHILGCWDSDPYHNLIAYETPLGRSLLGKAAGDIVDTPLGKAVIETISSLPEELRRDLSRP